MSLRNLVTGVRFQKNITSWAYFKQCGIFYHFPLNPLTPMSDQDRISPYNINTISSGQVMRIKKNIN